MAEAMLRQAISAAGLSNIEVSSAGIGATDGTPASEGAYLVLLERGLDLSGHRARLLTRQLVDEADLILTMGRSHLGRVRELGAGGRAYLLGEYAGRDGDRVEVRDPYGEEIDQYRETYLQLADLLPSMLSRLGGGT
jgi:protein-tyrosine-phosphatase